jgi:Flp pilus assembly protein TadG
MYTGRCVCHVAQCWLCEREGKAPYSREMARLPNHHGRQTRPKALGHFDSGQALVEFTLLLPFLLALLFGSIEVSRAVYSQNALTNAAYRAAYYGMIHPTDVDGIKKAAISSAIGITLNKANIKVTCEPCDSRQPIDVAITYRFESVFTPLIPTFTLNASAKYYIQ